MSQTWRAIERFDAEAWKVRHAVRDGQIARQGCDTTRMISRSRDLLERTKSFKWRKAANQSKRF